MAAGGGGRLAPPASKSDKKKCGKLGHSHCYRLCRLDIPTSGSSENKSSHETRKPPQKNKKFPRYLKNPKNLKSSEKNENHAVGYSKNQQLGKNSKKNFGRMREILGAYRKKPITRKSLLWNFEISISEWCDTLLVTWPFGIINPFRNRFINRLIRAIFKKLTFPKNTVGAKKSKEFDRSIHFSTVTQKVGKVGHSNFTIK